MNLGVGIISDKARKAILECGGSIGPAANPELFLVQLPDEATFSAETEAGQVIVVSGITLQFTRAWETKDCRIETKEEALNPFRKGKETGKRFAKAFFGTPLPAICLATLGMVTADLIADQRDRDRYVDGFVAGFYEVNPAEPTGVSI